MPVPDLPYGSIAADYDRVMSFFERRLFGRLRARLIPKAVGDVLEVGGGTGANLMLYENADSLTLTDPDPKMIELAEAKPRRTGIPILFEVAAAEELPFPDANFDTVVSTLVLCSVSDPDRALDEIRRVLRPDGKLLLLEHVRPPAAMLGFFADVLTPLQKRLAGGCHLNRRTVETVAERGFAVEDIRRHGYGIVAVIEGRRM